MDLKDRLPLSINKSQQSLTQLRLQSARHSIMLLQRRSDGLHNNFETVKKKLINSQVVIQEAMANAKISLAEVKFVAGDIGKFVLENVNTARLKVICKKENAFGVILNSFQSYEEGIDSNEYLCLARGGQQVAKAKQKYKHVIELLVNLASAQQSFFALNKVIKNNNRRINVLKCILIPRLERTLLYIVSELDENDRNEFYRLKNMLKKKKIAKISKSINNIHISSPSTLNLLEDLDEDILDL